MEFKMFFGVWGGNFTIIQWWDINHIFQFLVKVMRTNILAHVCDSRNSSFIVIVFVAPTQK